MDFEQLIEQANAFLCVIGDDLEKKAWDIQPHWDIDHICYRTSTLEEYEQMRSLLKAKAMLLGEHMIGERPIATFKLHEPLILQGKKIGLVELPAPKEGKATPSGFEHIEVVADLPFSSLEQKYSLFPQDKSGLSKAFNQELKVGMGKYNVKFHHLSLESVISLENQHDVMQALLNSRLLERLKDFSPLVAGTFPLGISKQGSDIDLLLCAHDLSVLEGKLSEICSDWQGFEVNRGQQEGQPYIVVNFEFEGIPFELFGQQQDSVRQLAYKHFQIEERLLKLGDPGFKLKIESLRAEGLKTEPAFAQALGLSGDPFLELLSMHTKSDSELQSYLEGARVNKH